MLSLPTPIVSIAVILAAVGMEVGHGQIEQIIEAVSIALGVVALGLSVMRR